MARIVTPFVLASLIACQPRIEAADAATTAVDAGDAGPIDTESPRDGGVCAATPLVSDCYYHGYGTTCAVPCTFSGACTFDVDITWSSGYCCGSPHERFVDCVCESGYARCRPAFVPSVVERTPPTTTCEFCEPRDAGIDAYLQADADATASAP